MYTILHEKRLIYLKTDAAGVGLGSDLLQVSNGIQFQQDEAPDDTALCCKAFTSKNLDSTEKDIVI